MVRRIVALACLIAFLGVAAALVRATEPAQIQWLEQVQDAWQKAQADERPLLIYVSREGCGYCRKMERDTLSDPALAATVSRGFVAVKLDSHQDPVLTQRLGVRVYPTTVIISPTNKVLDSIRGYVPAEQLSQRLDKLAMAATARKPGGTVERR